MDYSILKYIQDHRWASLDELIILISEETTSITIGAISGMIFLGLIIKDKYKNLTLIGLKTLVVIIMNALVIGILKAIVNRPRPFDTYSEIVKMSSGGSPSFPSGHTAEVFALAFSMLFILKNKIAFYIFLAWAIIVAYTRLATGVHYPSDVLAGALIGAAMAYLIAKLFEKYLPEVNPKTKMEKEKN